MSADPSAHDVWDVGAGYEAYIGRWSRLVAREVVAWLGAGPHGRWLDAGCGTGALGDAIAAQAAPAVVVGLDRSLGFVAHARGRTGGAGRAFVAADAQVLPVRDGAFDAVVSALVLNFVAEPARMVAELARAARPGAPVALYVWDYADGMEYIRRFWDAARALDPAAAALDEAVRFPICAPGPLSALLEGAGLADVEVRAVEVPTSFRDFAECWAPFLAGQGPAPAYAMSLPEDRRAALRDAFRAALPVAPDGTIPLRARAWAARGRR
ncbi:class I SAM-dependent methyltransferase [Anaeromyxobacter sp. PSR-1]|uniref:class I SAM-dependent methyltransferase n=1 Tax=Anaeromyxobacter sp. PSR-1 TaxID=1300915 RepID=UPI0005E2FBC4|nr:class I SAM-dependent methyltransferase [Anaeromyxobacter sp. PSR-1]GAO03715.1 malonyl-[acyl-carrier protein] O-methyltransferase [Anaeromyxobacter sp. PSR-1]